MRAFAGLSSHPMRSMALALTGLGLCAWFTTRVALDQRKPPQSCPPGMSAQGGRCCGDGQTWAKGACSGRARACSIAQELDDAGQCVARFGVVSFEGGELFIGAADWDGAGGGERFPRTRVAPFRLDVAEVTRDRFVARTRPSDSPGLPVSNVSPAEAEAFCRTQRGRLPTAAEWVWAAAGNAARRFPWGNSGLVCRRAAFGLVQGPCGTSGGSDGAPAGAELVGSRPDGASPEGVLDLAGNVAEWTRETGGGYAARGGSFRSTSAAELKSWASLGDHDKALHIGFRCAYPP
jgi:formylglycine-generating enzyme required for sulfatase activity